MGPKSISSLRGSYIWSEDKQMPALFDSRSTLGPCHFMQGHTVQALHATPVLPMFNHFYKFNAVDIPQAETDKTRNPKLEMPGRPVVGVPTTPRERVHGKQLLQLAPGFRTPKMLQLLETVKGLRLMGTTA